MSAKIIFLATILAVAKAGFLATPTVVVPGYGRHSTTVYHGSSLSYRPNLAYRGPQTYDGQLTVTATLPERSEDTAARETSSNPAPSPSSATKNTESNTNFDSGATYSYSYNLKDSEAVRAKAQGERMDERIADTDGARSNVEYKGDGRYNTVETKASTATSADPAPTQAVSTGEKLILVTAPAFYHATPVAYNGPVAYDTHLTYHSPVAKVLSDPVGKFAYSTSQISYSPTQSPTLLEDCLSCPQY